MSDLEGVATIGPAAMDPAAGAPDLDLGAPIAALDAATERLREAIAQNPDDAALWLKLGAMLQAAGARAVAAVAYRTAIALQPTAAAYLELGRVLRLEGEQEEAIEAFEHALVLDSSLTTARSELIGLGAQHRIPHEGPARDRRWSQMDAHSNAGFRSDGGTLDTSQHFAAAYNEFRQRFPISPPPEPGSVDARVVILIDAGAAAPALLRATLRSLTNQTFRAWHGLVVASPSLSEHPVGSFAHVDDRIAFVTMQPPDAARVDAALVDADRVVTLSAGTTLDPQGLAWMLYAAERSHAGAVYCDHDRGIEDWRHGQTFAEPVLYGVFDVDSMMQTRRPPPAVLVTGHAMRALFDRDLLSDGPEFRRFLMLSAANQGALAHVPRVLATVVDIPRVAEGGPASPDWPDPTLRPPVVRPSKPWVTRAGDRLFLCSKQFGGASVAVTQAIPAVPDERVLVVIPTRDQPDLLERCLASLRFLARRPERIDYVIVDNRSTAPDTSALLARERSHGATVMAIDEPFNWSRLNNLAAATGCQPNIVFANNDIEMLTPGWDEIIVQALQRSDIGAVGPRLLYPDGTIQHAGMLFVEGAALVQHDGYHAAATDEGPDDRWITAHATAAVTGAFLAVRREVFAAIGGFDETLFVGYSDVDFCLKVRETEKTVHYTPAIELVHHESISRGHNISKDRVAWDQGELTDLYARWGASLQQDPGYNPQWAPGVSPFDRFREPTLDAILDWIDLSTSDHPWRPARRAR